MNQRLIDLFINFALVFMLMACDRSGEKYEKISYQQFDYMDAPMISVTGIFDSALVYKIIYDYCPSQEISLSSTGVMFKKLRTFNFALDSPKTYPFRFFDLTDSVGQSHLVEIRYFPNRLGLDRIVKEVVLERNELVGDKEIFVFRVRDIYCFEEEYLDVVFFVSAENGVMGSYISLKEANQEYYTWRRGNTFDNLVDYTKMKEVSLQ